MYIDFKLHFFFKFKAIGDTVHLTKTETGQNFF